MERIALFIDGPDLHNRVKSLGFETDFARLRDHFVDQTTTLFRPYFFTVTNDGEEFEHSIPLIDWLEYNGYTVVARVSRTEAVPLATEIAVKAMQMAQHYDCAIIISGDQELVPLAETLADMGKRVVVVSTKAKCSNDLRRLADWFVDLAQMKDAIARKPSKEPVAA